MFDRQFGEVVRLERSEESAASLGKIKDSDRKHRGGVSRGNLPNETTVQKQKNLYQGRNYRKST